MSKVKKAIILAGGSGTRLSPLTKIISKHLLPVYDKPMIYYPLSTVMLSGIKEILIISENKSINQYKKLLGNGTQYGIRISYAIQEKPNGIAEAILIGEKFIKKSSFLLILGDNFIHGENIGGILKNEMRNMNKAKIFAYPVSKPEEYGILEVKKNNKILSIKEKPKNSKSKLAVIGLYLYPNSAIKMAKKLKKSDRGELEITDLNNMYLKKNELKAKILGRGYTWLDLGTQDSLIEGALFIKLVQDRTSVLIGCIEEIAINNKWIKIENLKKFLNTNNVSKYFNRLNEHFIKNKSYKLKNS